METFCDDLRSERERRNISLDTVSAITKVPLGQLVSLEAGELSRLPGGVFRKGIVRGYLGAIGADEQPWMQRFEAALAAIEPTPVNAINLAEFVENISRTRPEPSPPTDVRWVGVTTMAFMVAVLGWCLWHFVLHGRVVLSSSLRN